MKPITSTYWPEAAAAFSRATAAHEMTVLKDDGLYRHLRFQKPTSSWQSYFDLVTWPGSLVIRGDMGTFMFTREPDMIRDFFTGRGAGINADYWAEKMPGGRESVKEFDEKLLRAYVWQRYREHCDERDLSPVDRTELWRDLRFLLQQDHDLSTAIAALSHFDSYNLTFPDAWDLSGAFTGWSWHYLWCCCAVAAGCRDYVESFPTTTKEAA
jgi:hypothetical protein